MKRIITLAFVFLFIVSAISCTRAVGKVKYLEGEVTEIGESGVTVKITDSGTSGIPIGSLAFFGIKDSMHIGMADKVSLTYSGEVTETEPLRFSGPYQLEVIEKAPRIEEKSPDPENELPKGTVTEIGRGELNPDIELSRADSEVLLNILDGEVWEKVDTECTRDCKVVINGVLYYYHSECGVFFRPNLAEYSPSSFKKTKNPGESLELNDELKAEVNEILEKYITLGFPDFYPDKFEVLISDFESVRAAKEESEEAIINLLQRQSYTEHVCDCLPDVVVRHDGKDYGVKLSAEEAFIRLEDKQAPLSPEDISELWKILTDNQIILPSESTLYHKISNIQYIRTDGYNNFFEHKNYLVRVTSKEELYAYYNYFSGIYDFKTKEKLYYDTTIGFKDAIQKYDNVYFEKHDLYLAVLEEGSGSIRHKVEGVKNGYVEIKSVSPEECTDDMANWHIVMEVEKGFHLWGINGRELTVYTPEYSNQKVISYIESFVREWLIKEYESTDVEILGSAKTSWGNIKGLGFENPYGYNPGWDESPVWIFDVSLGSMGEMRIYASESIVFGYN